MRLDPASQKLFTAPLLNRTLKNLLRGHWHQLISMSVSLKFVLLTEKIFEAGCCIFDVNTKTGGGFGLNLISKGVLKWDFWQIAV